MSRIQRVRRKWIVNPRYQIQFAVVLVLLNVNVGLVYQIALNYRMRVLAEEAGSIRNFLAVDPWSSLWPATLVAAVVTGLAVFLIGIRYSNQIVGPLPRVTGAMSQLSSGTKPDRLKFRPGDVFEELADTINNLSDSIHPQGAQDRATSTDPVPEALAVEDESEQVEPIKL